MLQSCIESPVAFVCLWPAAGEERRSRSKTAWLATLPLPSPDSLRIRRMTGRPDPCINAFVICSCSGPNSVTTVLVHDQGDWSWSHQPCAPTAFGAEVPMQNRSAQGSRQVFPSRHAGGDRAGLWALEYFLSLTGHGVL